MHRNLLIPTVLAVVVVGSPARAEDGKLTAEKLSITYAGVNDKGAEEWIREKDRAVVIRVPQGPYLKRPYEGWEAEDDPKPVEVGGLFIDKYEVTNQRFARFLNARKDTRDFFDPSVPGLVREGKTWSAAEGLGLHPCTSANGRGAIAFAKWVGGRLPKVDEWEKAASGPEGRMYPWGDEKPDASRANFGIPVPRGTDPVGAHPRGASPYGCLDMAGNAYERVMARFRGGVLAPTIIKGGSWVSANGLNLRALDLCVQPTHVSERSVSFRVVMDDPEPERPSRKAHGPGPGPSREVPQPAAKSAAKPRRMLTMARDFDEAVKEAKRRRVPILLALLHETCGQSDRTREQLFHDPKFVAYANEKLVVAVGHHPYHAFENAHKPLDDGKCPLYDGLTCEQHESVYTGGLQVVTTFRVSPGNFLLHPDRCTKNAGADAILMGEGELPKWGNPVADYIDACDRARKEMASE